MFGRKRDKASKALVDYDPKNQLPVLKCSICNGEKIAGFKDKKSGRFTEVAFIRSEQDLEEFMETYHVREITKEY